MSQVVFFSFLFSLSFLWIPGIRAGPLCRHLPSALFVERFSFGTWGRSQFSKAAANLIIDLGSVIRRSWARS